MKCKLVKSKDGFSFNKIYDHYPSMNADKMKMLKLDLLFAETLDGESLVKDILNTDGVSSIVDENGKRYWWNTIDKSKTYQVRKYKYDRALQDHSVISYEIKEL